MEPSGIKYEVSFGCDGMSVRASLRIAGREVDFTSPGGPRQFSSIEQMNLFLQVEGKKAKEGLIARLRQLRQSFETNVKNLESLEAQLRAELRERVNENSEP